MDIWKTISIIAVLSAFSFLINPQTLGENNNSSLLEPYNLDNLNPSFSRSIPNSPPKRFLLQSTSNPQFAAHEPIAISADSDFEEQGFPGAGTKADPYRIEGFNITSTNGSTSDPHALISIQNTSAHFLVAENFLNGLAKIEVRRFEPELNPNVSVGIKVIYANNGKIRENQITSTAKYGILIEESTNVSVEENTMWLLKDAIGIVTATNNHIIGNDISDTKYDAIRLRGASYNIIRENTLNNIKYSGIKLENDHYPGTIPSEYNYIAFNHISNSRQSGIWLDRDAQNNTITANWMRLIRDRGVMLWSGSRNNIVEWNSFLDNTPYQANDDGINNQFSYNFWNDWTTPDTDSDDIVDMSYNIPGSANNQDEHPRTNDDLARYPMFTLYDAKSSSSSATSLELPIVFGSLVGLSIFQFISR
ncbi:MAG: right-handed parallel beta-helix repeat-containing protein, partial [Candidatus Hodarchaeales archaeon]